MTTANLLSFLLGALIVFCIMKGISNPSFGPNTPFKKKRALKLGCGIEVTPVECQHPVNLASAIHEFAGAGYTLIDTIDLEEFSDQYPNRFDIMQRYIYSDPVDHALYAVDVELDTKARHGRNLRIQKLPRGAEVGFVVFLLKKTKTLGLSNQQPSEAAT